MSDTNRVRVAVVKETTLGTTPGSPRMRTARITGSQLAHKPLFVTSAEIRSDRMSPDPPKINEQNDGPLPLELSYPVDNTFLSEVYRSAFCANWTNAPSFDNDGTADSIITDAGTVANTYAVNAGGTAAKLGHLVRATGFTNAANNITAGFRVASSTATTIVGTALGLTAEAVPPGTARLKVIGFQGAAGDITATATGLASTALDFTTLGLATGMWLKVGGTAAGVRFANVAADNDWIRINGTITATAIPCDNLPSGWGVDNGAGKTINVYFGDYIRNGTTINGLSIERGYLDQATPVYVLQKGMIVDTLAHAIETEKLLTGSAAFMGFTGVEGTVANGTSYDAVTTDAVMAANVNVGRIAEAGAVLASPNWARKLDFSVKNNVRLRTAIGTVGAVDAGIGSVAVEGVIETYFGSSALLTKLMAGTVSNLNARAVAGSKAVVWTFPRVTFTDGNPDVPAINADVILPLKWMTSIDTTTNCEVQLDRLEYYE